MRRAGRGPAADAATTADPDRRRPDDRDLPPALLGLVEQARRVYPESRPELLRYRRTRNDAVAAEIADGGPLPEADALVVVSVSPSSVMRGLGEIVVDMAIAA